MCLFPITFCSVDSFGCDVVQTVPCGKCVECLKDKQNSWKIRICEEARDHLYCYFFTLTYNESSVPLVEHEGSFLRQVCKKHIQDWIKRNRIYFERTLGDDKYIKYFICSEYGPNTGRPHYHGILFSNISLTFIARMFNDWKQSFGFTSFSLVGQKDKVRTCSSPSAVGNYVAKYCYKVRELMTDVEKDISELIVKGVLNPTFHLMSKGIGEKYILRMKRYHVPAFKGATRDVPLIVDRSCYHDGCFKYKLPRYYRDRLYRKKEPCDARVWNNKLKTYENKIVYRYKSKNLLSLQMQAEIRTRILREHSRLCSQFRVAYPTLTESEIIKKVSFFEADSRKARSQDIYQKMSRFYNNNRFKSPKF